MIIVLPLLKEKHTLLLLHSPLTAAQSLLCHANVRAAELITFFQERNVKTCSRLQTQHHAWSWHSVYVNHTFTNALCVRSSGQRAPAMRRFVRSSAGNGESSGDHACSHGTRAPHIVWLLLLLLAAHAWLHLHLYVWFSCKLDIGKIIWRCSAVHMAMNRQKTSVSDCHSGN